MYEVFVYIGMWKGFGILVNVVMIVYGEEIRSEILWLFDSYINKKLFVRVSINIFVVFLLDSLYFLIMIKLWYDNLGFLFFWYVN